MNVPSRVFDFNIHLPAPGATAEDILQAEASMTVPTMVNALETIPEQLGSVTNQGNFMLFNPRLFFGDSADLAPFTERLDEIAPGSCLTTLIDFRRPRAIEAVDRACDAGIGGIKFHPYFQQIGRSDYENVLKVALRAQRHAMFVCVCTSFGTTKMYAHDTLELAAFLADFIVDTPLVLLHSGGLRALEAMLLAEAKTNIWLETSFSINYWRGSQVEKDLAFAYRKVGANRILYGSDYPYVGMRSALEETATFLDQHGFQPPEVEAIMGGNAVRLAEARRS